MSADQIGGIVTQMGQAIGENSGLGGTLKFDFGGDGCIYIDGKSAPNSVRAADDPADCTISIALDDFLKMARGELDPTGAFMQGKLKVAGDMGLAMKLGPIMQKARPS